MGAQDACAVGVSAGNWGCAGGEGFFMHGKRLLSPTNYWAEVPGSGEKTPPI